MTPAKVLAFNRQLAQPAPDDTPPLSEELDYLAEKLQQQQELNAQLMCEVKRLQNENSRLVRMVRRFDVTSL